MSDLPGNCKQFSTFPCLARTIVSELTPLLDMSNFRDEYLYSAILSKYTGLGSTPFDVLEQRAYNAVFESERRNKKTNARIAKWIKQELMYTPNKKANAQNHAVPDVRIGKLSLRAVINTARALISDTIGEFSYEIFKKGRFTSGAAVGYKRSSGDLWYKYHGRVTCTASAAKYVLAFIHQHPGWVRHLSGRFGSDPYGWLEIVKGNVGFTIRKNSEEDRFACKEPTGNMLVQTSIGTHFRECLRLVGIDLNDQSNNRMAAELASLFDDGDATLDLKKASDSATVNLCRLLFEHDWFCALVIGRSPVGIIDKTPHTWEMISSMGNGFTFELESLIFWALSEAVRRMSLTPGRVLVYGDDLVVPQRCAHRISAVLGWCGFRINSDKSFIYGPFRESCGGHYHYGVDVTPIYIRKPITDTSRVIWFLNALRKWCDVGGICDPRFESLYKKYRRKYVDFSLWGGKRYGSISTLVTPHRLQGRLKMITDEKRIWGLPAVLRAFSYARHVDAGDFYRSTTAYGDRSASPVVDPQTYYEMYGTIPISSDMTRLCEVSPVVSYESSTSYNELFPDRIGLWPSEVS